MGDLGLLMALRVQGIASPVRASVASGDELSAVTARLTELVSEEVVTERSGRHVGFTLTNKGAELLGQLLSEEGLRANERLQHCYNRFLMVNESVLQACSDWQVRRDSGMNIPNDHSDPSYDHAVIDALVELHGRTKRFLKQMAACSARFLLYEARLDDCVERLLCGDRTAFNALLVESYHTVWFELHQDLMLTLGLEREG
ncbi:MAG: MarR family transcriptional regulator [Actinomycetota bacterium]